MKRRTLVVLTVILALMVSVGGAFSQDPVDPGTEELISPLVGTWGQYLTGSGTGTIWRAYNTGSPMPRGVYGWQSGATGLGYGVWGESNSTGGRGTLGYATANSGLTYGVWGWSNSPNGRGVYGYNNATSGDAVGVYGRSNSTAYGKGTVGLSTRTTGFQYGVWGETPSTSGRGVMGYATATSGNNYGVWGYTNSPTGRGVYGYNNATSGDAVGVWGQSNSAAYGKGVMGLVPRTSGFQYGVWGETPSTSGRGVMGFAASTTGLTFGVWGYSRSPAGRGVFGYTSSGTGSGYGVYGWSDAATGTGVYAQGTRYGMQTYSNHTSGDALYARATSTTGPAWAVNAHTASPTGWAGVFLSAGNGVYVGTPTGKVGLTVVGGSKAAAVQTAEGASLLYSEEATEVWFADYGFGKLQDGHAVISIDPLFAETVNLEVGYHVFLQVYGDAVVYVSSRTPTQFEVKMRNGDPNVEFSYRLVAKRLGYETDRLQTGPWLGAGVSILAKEEPATELTALEQGEELTPTTLGLLGEPGEIEHIQPTAPESPGTP
jgi:hypothetical protein